MNTNGRVTIPTDMDAVPETLDLLKRWGADAIRDCDGTEFPQELKDTGAKIYATYYTTRKDNAWAKANPDETQQCYIMTPFYTAADGALIRISCLSFAASAHAFETKARNAILMDYETGAYLFTKNHQEMIAPASMSKLMTVYVLLSKLKDGEISLDDKFTVSENAWRKGGAASGGSTMFLKIGQEVRVEDLLKGILIQSGNDACIVVAENLAGSEAEFAAMMNETAEKIGLHKEICRDSDAAFAFC